MKEAKRVKWGLISTGWIAEKFAADLAHASNGELYAVASRTIESADKFAKQFNIPNAYGSYEELLANPEVDVVYIGTPHPMHKENILSALHAGKSVLCEKPVTMNSAELEEVLAVAKERQLFFMEAMWTRYLKPIRQVREWLAEGKIGDVLLLKAEFGFRMEWDPNHRLLNPELGGGALLDAGIYPVSFASMIFGPNPERMASTAHIGETGVDEQFSIMLSYSEGRTAMLNGAIRLGLPNDAFIQGTKGYIHIPRFLFSDSATLYVDGEEPVVIKDDREFAGYAYEAEEVGRCLQEGLLESPVMTWEESLGIMRLLDQARGQWGLRYEADDSTKG